MCEGIAVERRGALAHMQIHNRHHLQNSWELVPAHSKRILDAVSGNGTALGSLWGRRGGAATTSPDLPLHMPAASDQPDPIGNKPGPETPAAPKAPDGKAGSDAAKGAGGKKASSRGGSKGATDAQAPAPDRATPKPTRKYFDSSGWIGKFHDPPPAEEHTDLTDEGSLAREGDAPADLPPVAENAGKETSADDKAAGAHENGRSRFGKAAGGGGGGGGQGGRPRVAVLPSMECQLPHVHKEPHCLKTNGTSPGCRGVEQPAFWAHVRPLHAKSSVGYSTAPAQNIIGWTKVCMPEM